VLNVLDREIARGEGVRHGRDRHGQRGGEQIDRGSTDAQQAIRATADPDQ
jgi:hypothetical protein